MPVITDAGRGHRPGARGGGGPTVPAFMQWCDRGRRQSSASRRSIRTRACPSSRARYTCSGPGFAGRSPRRYRTWPDPDTNRIRHGKLLISARSRCVTREHGSDTDHPCIKRSVSWSRTFGMALCNRPSSGEARTLPLCAAVGSMPIMVQAAGGRVFFASAISLRQIAGSARPLCVRGSPVRMRRIDRPAPL